MIQKGKIIELSSQNVKQPMERLPLEDVGVKFLNGNDNVLDFSLFVIISVL